MDSKTLNGFIDGIINSGNLVPKHELFDFLSALCMPV